MPFYLYVTKGYGISIETINESCPSDLQPYVDSHNIEEREKDKNNWMLGKYIESAVGTAIEHNFAGVKARTSYCDKPFLEQVEENRKNEMLTEEEKKDQTEKFFQMLQIMQSNFNLSKGNGKE